MRYAGARENYFITAYGYCRCNRTIQRACDLFTDLVFPGERAERDKERDKKAERDRDIENTEKREKKAAAGCVPCLPQQPGGGFIPSLSPYNRRAILITGGVLRLRQGPRTSYSIALPIKPPCGSHTLLAGGVLRLKQGPCAGTRSSASSSRCGKCVPHARCSPCPPSPPAMCLEFLAPLSRQRLTCPFKFPENGAGISKRPCPTQRARPP
jgi:hypothetical protein